MAPTLKPIGGELDGQALSQNLPLSLSGYGLSVKYNYPGARAAEAWGAFGPSVSTERSTEGFDRAQPRASRRGLDEVSGRGLGGYPLNSISFLQDRRVSEICLVFLSVLHELLKIDNLIFIRCGVRRPLGMEAALKLARLSLKASP